MLALAARTAELKAAGRDIIGSLTAGEPDFPPPDHIAAAAIDAIRRGDGRYTAVGGTLELRRAVRAKFERENDIRFALNEVTVAVGAKQMIFNAMMATLDAGDEVLIPSPFFPSYVEIVRLCGGKPVILPCASENGFKLRASQLASAIGPKTKWLILNSPSNPTGAVYSSDELRVLADVLLKSENILVLSDDIYEHLLLGGTEFSTISVVERKLKERTLVLNGVSKSYCMTGWRIGFAGGPAWLIEAIEAIQSQSVSCAPAISQKASVAALEGPQEFMNEHRRAYRRRRDLIVGRINATAFLTCQQPQGAFYAFVDCREALNRRTPQGRTLRDDTDFAAYLLDEGVAVVPGSVFGAPGHFRASFAADIADIAAACDRIQRACASLT